MKMFKICSVNVQKTILKLQTMLWKSPKNYFKKCSFLFWYSKKCLPKVVQDLVLKNSRKIFIPKTFKKKMFPKSLCQKFVLTKLSKSLFWKTRKNIFIPKTFKKKISSQNACVKNLLLQNSENISIIGPKIRKKITTPVENTTIINYSKKDLHGLRDCLVTNRDENHSSVTFI